MDASPPSRIFEQDNDPASEPNWMVDRERQAILDEPTYLKRLERQRLILEEALPGNTRPIPDPGITAAWHLLLVYRRLGLNAKANELAEWLEANDFEQSHLSTKMAR
jgi:hypothetical protein